MRNPGLKILDRYIIRKFLGTYFFSIALIIVIVVVFDWTEKTDDFSLFDFEADIIHGAVGAVVFYQMFDFYHTYRSFLCFT